MGASAGEAAGEGAGEIGFESEREEVEEVRGGGASSVR